MAIKPLSDRVLVLPNPAEEMEVKEGDTVMYGKYAGTEINYDGVDYLVMKQSDIIAIVD